MTASIQFDRVSFKYDEKEIIHNLSLAIQKGDFVSIIGPSGSGKSTLFRLMSRLEQPTSGHITLLDNNVGYMPQKDLLMPWRSIVDNVALPLQCQNVSKKESREKALHMLEQFGLKDYVTKQPKDLSGGMRQRVSFSRAMLAAGDVLLLDEPFSALDALTKMELQDWLINQMDKHTRTVIFITHDVEEAIYLSDYVLIISDQPVQQLVMKKVPKSRPRSREDLIHPDMIQLKNELLDLLKGGH